LLKILNRYRCWWQKGQKEKRWW